MTRSLINLISIDTDSSKKIMVIGGNGDSMSRTTAELFDGNSWTVLDELPIEILDVKAVVYKGKVTVTGQDQTGYPLPSALVFDVATRTWTTGFQLSEPIQFHNSFLVPKSYCN